MKTRKFFALLLALCLLVGCLPLSASAAGDFDIDENGVLIWYHGKDTHVVIPKGVKAIGEGAFGMCFVGSPDWTYIYDSDGNWINTSIELLSKYDEQYESYNRKIESITIPDGVTKIDTSAFCRCENLKTLNIPSSVTEIGIHAFEGTPWLNKQGLVICNDTVVACGKASTSVTVPKTVKQIGPEAFNDYITSIFIEPGELTVLGEYSLFGCWNLKKFYVPPTVKDFDRVWGWFDVDFPEGLTIYGAPGSYAETYARNWKLPFVASYVPYPGTSFYDIPQNAYYGEAVKWAVEKEITSGTSDMQFSPDAPCTRGQAVTFLWRAAGTPEPVSSETGFSDVKSGAYYEKAVKWAVENGITSGTGNGKFSPEATCTRAQIVTFMYRAENSPAVSEGSSFSDVASTAYYKDAVQWAAENEITSGTGNGKFSPENKCVRGQIVTFLYRYAE